MVNNAYIHAYMINNNIYYAHLTYVAFEHCVCHESLLTSFIFMYLDYIHKYKTQVVNLFIYFLGACKKFFLKDWAPTQIRRLIVHLR